MLGCAVTPKTQRARIASYNSFYRTLHLIFKSQSLSLFATLLYYYLLYFLEYIRSRLSALFQMPPKLSPIVPLLTFQIPAVGAGFVGSLPELLIPLATQNLLLVTL